MSMQKPHSPSENGEEEFFCLTQTEIRSLWALAHPNLPAHVRSKTDPASPPLWFIIVALEIDNRAQEEIESYRVAGTLDSHAREIKAVVDPTVQLQEADMPFFLGMLTRMIQPATMIALAKHGQEVDNATVLRIARRLAYDALSVGNKIAIDFHKSLTEGYVDPEIEERRQMLDDVRNYKASEESPLPQENPIAVEDLA